MASVYAPISETSVTPPFVVAGATGIPYTQILNFLNAFVFVVTKMKIIASSFPQLKQPIGYSYKDANGNYQSRMYIANTHANNKQPVDDVNVKMVFDGKSALNMSILSGQSVTLYFTGKAYKVEDYAAVSGNIKKLVAKYKGEDI
jgi:hypothetical protein